MNNITEPISLNNSQANLPKQLTGKMSLAARCAEQVLWSSPAMSSTWPSRQVLDKTSGLSNRRLTLYETPGWIPVPASTISSLNPSCA